MNAYKIVSLLVLNFPPYAITSICFISTSSKIETQSENQDNEPINLDLELNQSESSFDDTGRKRKRTSVVWQHFEEKSFCGEVKAVCNHCKARLTSGSTKKSQVITGDGFVKHGAYSFDEDNARKELTYMIILQEYSLSMVDHLGFKRFCNSLQPLFKAISRNTINRDIMTVFECEKGETMKLLQMNKSKIAITTDMWTSSNQKRGFMAITSHFIDASWMLQKSEVTVPFLLTLQLENGNWVFLIRGNKFKKYSRIMVKYSQFEK
ncbi:hypothetical protein DVH24_034339 [Malus domestica]|uniref:BED-type domain-containing protein n=1 Tax=Malus domestica TaxID=3750 RepID=A0A498IVQ1_MALDO|nr:hypothetical protein DVH24_034339 [Malus domestica]